MQQANNRHIRPLLVVLFLLTTLLPVAVSCSTTSHLPEDEVLYTGIKEIKVENKNTLNPLAEENALIEVEAALAFEPNNSFMGSSSIRTPFPVGLWLYNSLVTKEKSKFSKWIFNNFASTPVTLSKVSPDTRIKVATNTLQNYGYFQGNVNYSIIDQKNPKKKKISYNVNLGTPYLIDSIRYVFPPAEDSLLQITAHESPLHKNDQFNIVNLQSERERITNSLRNHGYYYYRPDYIVFLADSVIVPHKVQLLVAADRSTPPIAHRKWYNGNTSVYIRNNEERTASGRNRTERDSTSRADRGSLATSRTNRGLNSSSRTSSLYTDSVTYRNATIYYSGKKCPIAPRVLMRNIRFRKGREYSQDRMDESLVNINNMRIFSRVQFNCAPRDTLGDILDARLECTMDKLIDAELDLSITQKSNAQVGPSAALTLSKRNAFGHGETFSVKAKGSYEWQTSTSENSGLSKIDSYEAGIDASITYPWIVFPGLSQKRFRNATSSTFALGFNHLKRAGYYRLLSINASSEYHFQTNRYYTHRLSPLSMTYNKLEQTTARFDSIASKNRALYVSLQDKFIPALEYSIIYDNNFKTDIPFYTQAELTVKESGNAVSGIFALTGQEFDRLDKKLLNVPYAQFFKLTFDIRHKLRLTTNSLLATHFFTGMVWSYGNSTIAPYSEQFYVGGANSIRAFGAHTIGPGSYHDYEGRGTYLDQSGNFKLEASLEYRFKMVGSLYGALFLDAGNVWNTRDLDSHPGGYLGSTSFLRDLATGTGLGFRYNLDILVLRLDFGVALHEPYDTGRPGYYNIRTFFRDGFAFHFAVGYPF